MIARTLIGLLTLAAAAIGQGVEALVADLSSPEFEVRQAAEAALAAAGEPARAPLERALASEDLEVRERAARILEGLRFAFLDGSALAWHHPELATGLRAADVARRRLSGLALCRAIVDRDLGREIDADARRALELLAREMAGNPDHDRERRKALAVLGDVDCLVWLARTGDLPTDLGRHRYRGTGDDLVEAMARSEGRARRTLALALLVARFWRLETVPAPTARRRAEALAMARDLGPTGGALRVALGDPEGLPEALSSPDLDVALRANRDPADRREMLRAAARLSEDDLVGLAPGLVRWIGELRPEEIAGHAADAEPRVRELSALALGQRTDGGDLLDELALDPDAPTRLAAAHSLALRGDRPSALAAARRTLDERDGEAVRDACWLLVELGDRASRQPATLLLSDPRPAARVGAAYLLARTGRPPPAIAGLVGDTSPVAFYRHPKSGVAAMGTVDLAVRGYVEVWLDEPLPGDVDAARAVVRRALE